MSHQFACAVVVAVAGVVVCEGTVVAMMAMMVMMIMMYWCHKTEKGRIYTPSRRMIALLPGGCV